MPFAALKPCSYCHISLEVPGNHGRCKDHPYADAHIQEHQKLYDTRLWKRIRARQLAKEPWCAECLKENRYTPATDCDHIEPHRGDPAKFFKGPFQSLCHPHHSQKTVQEIGWGRGDQNVLTWGVTSGRGQQREKNSPIEAGNR
jgi:hypothetical protein